VALVPGPEVDAAGLPPARNDSLTLESITQ
jgi:hypothetical protein